MREILCSAAMGGGREVLDSFDALVPLLFLPLCFLIIKHFFAHINLLLWINIKGHFGYFKLFIYIPNQILIVHSLLQNTGF